MADIIADVLNDLLGENGVNILQEEGISVSYYEHEDIFDVPLAEPIGNRTKYYPDYNEALDIKSLMWTIPFGQTIEIPIPGLNFKLPSGRSAACVCVSLFHFQDHFSSSPFHDNRTPFDI